ncbi:CS1-pili formation C-terminal domain-containing protein [Photobacterium damselae]|uniref:CS1-pili formation C-terminal domain-containing protein n=1 Tax=Photobacterium damselae TaxID=38293 RepID=UPI0035A94A91
MRLLYRYINIILILFSYNAYCIDIPEDFNDFYTFKPTVVELRSVDGIKKEVELLANYNTVRITKSSTEISIIDFLNQVGVKADTQSEIIKEFRTIKGIKSTDKCIGSIDKCIVNSEKYDFLLDFDNKKLYFYISNKNLNEKVKNIDFVSNMDENPALINTSNLYFNVNDGEFSETLNDQTVLGLRYGHFASDFSYHNNDSVSDDFDLRKLAYILNYKSYQLQIGTFDGTVDYNSVGFLLGNSNNTKNTSINISSSDNLLINDSAYYQSLDFYSQSSGYLTIKRDHTIIYQNNVSAGAGNIPYSMLPKGVYDVEVTITSNGQKAFNQIYHIYNVQNGHLSKGKIDFMVSTGIYTEDIMYSEISEMTKDDLGKYNDSWFYRGSIAYGLSDALMVGGDFELSEISSNYRSKLGMSYLFGNGSRLSVLYGRYNKGSIINTINLSTPWFSFNYDDFKLEEDDAYAAYIEGSGSKRSISFNKNIIISPVLSGNIMYTYNKYNISSDDNNSWNITTSADYRFGSGSVLSGQIMYDKYNYDYSNNGEFSANINISFPIGNNLKYTMYASNVDHKFDVFRNEMSIDDLYDEDNDKYLSLNLGHEIYGKSYNEEHKAYININGNYNTDKLRGNMYAFVDTLGEQNANIGLSNTQVISKYGIDFTTSNSTSYMKLDIKNDDERIKNLGLFTINANKRLDNKRFIYKKNNLIPLKEYEKYTGILDTESVSLENNGDKEIQGFSFPGSVYTMKPNVSKIVSFITAFDDIFERDIEHIKCTGEGCVDIENIDGNIFSIKVRAGKEFVLKSDSLVCLTPGVKNIKNLNLGLNHCVPDIENMEDGMMLAGPDGKNNQIYYLGIFDKSEREQYLAKLLKYNVIEQEYNEKENIVYVSFKGDYLITKNDKSLFNRVMLTANNSSEISPYVLELDKTWFNNK